MLAWVASRCSRATLGGAVGGVGPVVGLLLPGGVGVGAAWLPGRAWYRQRANELRPGHVCERGGQLVACVKAAHTQGQGRAAGNVQVEWKPLGGGGGGGRNKYGEKLRPDDTVERVRLDAVPFQFLFVAEGVAHLMHPETFEQLELDGALLGDGAELLDGDSTVKVLYHNGAAISAELPETVTCVVESAAPHMKGETKDGRSLKPATLANGRTLNVPTYVEAGDRVVVSTADGAFVKRATS